MLRRPDPVDPLSLNVGQDGCYFDARYLATYRQDNFDTAAVVGQPVGMLIDTWNGAPVLGADIVTNGDFSGGTTGWTAGTATLSSPASNLRVTNTSAASGRGFQSLATVVGLTYICTVNLGTNANGARVAVGTTNSNSNLLNLPIAAGVTGSYTFYFIATTTTSFIKCYTDSTTVGHFTEWDNVTCKHFPGKNIIQQTPGARPILRQHSSGMYWLEPDGADDFMTGPLATLLQLPSYIFCTVHRKSDVSQFLFSMVKSSSNYHAIQNRASSTFLSVLREATLGQSVVVSKPLCFGVGRVETLDSVAIVGLTDTNSGRTVPPSTANSWLAGTTASLSGPSIFSTSGTVASPGTNGIGSFGWINMEPTPDQRVGVRTFLNDLVGAD